MDRVSLWLRRGIAFTAAERSTSVPAGAVLSNSNNNNNNNMVLHDRLAGDGSRHAHHTRQMMDQNNNDKDNGNRNNEEPEAEQEHSQPSGENEGAKENEATEEETNPDDNANAGAAAPTSDNDNDNGNDSDTTEEGETKPEAATASAQPPGESASSSSTETNVETRIDLVKLVPFDVKMSLLSGEGSSAALNTFALTDIVTDWMDESLAVEVKRMEMGMTHSAFDSVILEERSLSQLSGTEDTTNTGRNAATGEQEDGVRRRRLQAEQETTTIAAYEGVTLWKHTTPSNLQVMTPVLLEDLERQALLQDDRLLELLQASPAQGLGSRVTDVRAYINPNPTTYVQVPTSSDAATANDGSSNTNANLELIIVVAIVVACMAFAFLVFSLFWAWRFDQQRRDAYRVGEAQKQQAKHAPSPIDDDDDGPNVIKTPTNMNVVVNHSSDDDTALGDAVSETNPTTGLYPESVISEDISTSLSAYYRSGMGTRPLYTSSRALQNEEFNDQASFSSMESYGYSLDGYAPSLGGNTYANNTGTRHAEEESKATKK